LDFVYRVFPILARFKASDKARFGDSGQRGLLFSIELGPTLKVFEFDSGFPMPYSILARFSI